MIFDWIHDCSCNHQTCIKSESTNPQIRPKRLVKVGDASVGEAPHLVITSQIKDTELKYAALSYCWGPTSSLRLTTTSTTLADRLSSLLWETLPPTYRDAFIVTRELNLRYIWIDSLCIIQDDNDDWQLEAARMGEIYRNAYITIAAVAASSTNDGFLDRECPYNSVEIPFTSPRHPEITGHYYVSYSGRFGEQEEFFQDVELSEWNKRGWTFQERLLSHRILFFGKRMLHFECGSLRRSENYEGTFKRNVRWHDLIQKGYTWSSLRSSWKELAENYSTRSFTLEVDKLPALSSLAQELSRALCANGESLEYLAGLWARDLSEDLLWISSKPQIPSSNGHVPARGYIAPSWSWSSSSGVISWIPLRFNITSDFNIDCDIREAKTTTSNTNRMGCVTGGFLEIKGPITRKLLYPTVKQDVACGIGFVNVSQDLDISFDHTLEPTHRNYVVTRGVWLALLCHTPRRVSFLDSNGSKHRRRCDVYFGLVLVPLDMDREIMARKFRRVGIFQTTRYPWFLPYDCKVYWIF